MGIGNAASKGLFKKEGKGVRKNMPEKKPFFRFWEIFSRRFWNLVVLGLLYLLLCLPIVTIGAATAGLTYVLRNMVIGRPVMIKDDFFEAFRKNWKQATVVWLLQAIVLAIDCFAVYFYYSVVVAADSNSTTFWIYMIGLAVTLGIFIILLFMSFYIYLMMSSFDFKLKSLLKNSFFFSGIGLKNNFIALLGYIAFFALGFGLIATRVLLPLGVFYLLLLTVPFCGLLSVFCAFPLIRKHIIDPYYAENGLENPLDVKQSDEEAIFQDDVTQKYEEEQLKKNTDAQK